MSLKKQDYINGRDFWLWAAENPGYGKDEWPEFERITSYDNWCPFCSVYWHFDGCSQKCPMVQAGNECHSEGYNEFENMDWYSQWFSVLRENSCDLTIKRKNIVKQACLNIANLFQQEADKCDD